MPKISIYEKDLTALSAAEIVDNVVYIPGYAVKGPVNTPTLITSLSNFIEVFGSAPYVFRNAQPWPTGYSIGNYALAGIQEKSYIYAAELLNRGLPVLFERVMKEVNIPIWTPELVLPFTDGEDINNNFIIKSKNPGMFYEKLGCTLIKSGTEYLLDIFLDAVRVERIRFNFEPSSDNYFIKKQSNYIVFPEFNANLPTELDEQITEINFTLPAGTDSTLDEFVVTDFYDLLTGYDTTASVYEKLIDKDEYDIKFITSGSYPVYNLVKNVVISKDGNDKPLYLYSDVANLTEMIIAVAGTRGDSIALIDYNNYTTTGEQTKVLDIHSDLQVDDSLQKLYVGSSTKFELAMKYGTMVAPWGTYRTQVILKDTNLPGSFGYLLSYANSVQNNPNYYAIAGVTRGIVLTLKQPNEVITGAKAQALQEGNININPITFVNPYGYCIWGNRTLNKNIDEELVASSFLNVRILANDVKKLLFRSSKRLTFENDTDILWINFKSLVEPELENMISGNGLTGYRLLRKASTKRATVEVVVRLYVVEAVEDFDITVELTDSYVNIQ